MKSLSSSDTGKWRVSTSSGAAYVIDMDTRRGKRMPSDGSRSLVADNQWFLITSIVSCTVGQPLHLLCLGLSTSDWYTWRVSTPIVSIDLYEDQKPDE